MGMCWLLMVGGWELCLVVIRLGVSFFEWFDQVHLLVQSVDFGVVCQRCVFQFEFEVRI